MTIVATELLDVLAVVCAMASVSGAVAWYCLEMWDSWS